MTHTISTDRKRLTIHVDEVERTELRELGETIHQDETMHDFLEPLTCNSELEWIPEGTTSDLTSAPMLGIYSQEQPNSVPDWAVPNYGSVAVSNLTRQFVLERWTFMDYQVRSVLEDLRDRGEAIFTSN